MFLSVACGNTAFGLFVRPWAVLLGHISYSIYLLHCLSDLAVDSAPGSGGTAVGGGEFMVVSAGLVAVVVLVSTLTYRFVEHPFLRLHPFRKQAQTMPVSYLNGNRI